jgi:hypothetical protein
MNNTNQPSVYHRRSLFVWAWFCVLAGLIFLAYACTSLAMGRGVFVMPLDDVYIHFQYAKQMALGQPYIYNPGLPATSGATSFLYPYMLAVGYLLGFQGLNLGLWAMLLGMVALVGSTWLVYRLVKKLDAPEWLAILAGTIFALSGPVSWHFMSGMETGWAVLFTLGTVYALMIYPPPLRQPFPLRREGGQHNTRLVIIFATLLALIRPEGGILAGLAVVALFFQVQRVTPLSSLLPVYGEGENMTKPTRRRFLPLLIPILAIGIQPLVNLLLTGSAVASGNAAKSVLGMIPFYWDAVIGRILGNWAQMWTEFFTGSSPREGLYITPWMLMLAVIGLLALLRKREKRVVGLMLIGWLTFGTLAISTLDTAFWHFKRYQMPFIALLFPLAGWGLLAIGNIWRHVKRRWSPYLNDPGFVLTPRVEWGLNSRIEVLGIFVAVGLAYTIMTSFDFLSKYALNVGYVYQQPLQMARWLEANTLPDAVIAVHDVGMMRYMGGRTTLDMVGLTTPGAADYWRNGPGSVAEFLIEKRPDYIASYGYGHGFGLGMLADTDLYGQPLASFPVDLDPNYNVALAANFQGIYKPDWALINGSLAARQPLLDSILYIYYLTAQTADSTLVDSLNVADIASETAHHYKWQNSIPFSGFPSEAYEFNYANCGLVFRDGLCPVVDGGRRIGTQESFVLTTEADKDLILITRLHPFNAGSFDVYANENLVATRWIPAIAGNWLEVPTLIPAKYVTTATTSIRIVPHVENGFYMPYYHWGYQGKYRYLTVGKKSVTSFQANAAIDVVSATISNEDNAKQAALDITWYTGGSAQGDYKVFVHILDANDQIVAQADTYPGNGTLPPGNWLPGILHDRIMVDLQNAPPGKYRVAMGLYNPYTFERLQPAGGDVQNRFFIGDVEIK